MKRLAGIGHFNVHRMRHAFACQSCDQGGNLAVLQQALDHASIETTQRYAPRSDEAPLREVGRIHAP